MENNNVIKGSTEDEIWQQISEEFAKNPDPLEYTAVIEHGNHRIVLDIDIDLGGGFESGYETTSLTAHLPTTTDFRFAIHKEHFTDEIGKFFGMQDVLIGYEEFDKNVVIKTNDERKVKELFVDPSVRSAFQHLDDFTFGITTHHVADSTSKDPYLELNIENGITDVNKLRAIYKAFYNVLSALDN